MRLKTILICTVVLFVVGVSVYAQDPTATPTPTPLPTATAIPPTATPLPTATPIPQAAFVSPQAARPDGSVVHVVQFGDTLDGIIFAYGNLGIIITIEDLMRFNNWRFKPQFIYVGDEIIILPPGSVDPNTGQLLVTEVELDNFNADGQAAPAATAAPADTSAQPEQPSTAPGDIPSEPGAPAMQSIEPFVPVESLTGR